MRVLTVIGNRPQFVKAAAVSRPLRERHEEVLVHTGQHYDDDLWRVFVDELDIPPPEIELGIGGGSNTSQTARQLGALEQVLDDVRPDVVLVYGDTNSTLAGSLAAAQANLPVAHVEAGMRSFDRSMPEEINRVMSDHLAALLLCSSHTAADNLEREGVRGRIDTVGDVMVDVADLFRPAARARVAVLASYGVAPGEYVLATAHRVGTVDDPARLGRLVELLLNLPAAVVLPLHPRTRRRLAEMALLDTLAQAAHLRLSGPVGYLDFTALLVHAKRGLDRLWRCAEGGLSRWRSLGHHARSHRVEGNRRGGLEQPGRPRRRRRCSGPRPAGASAAPPALRRRPCPAASGRRGVAARAELRGRPPHRRRASCRGRILPAQ